MRFLSLLNPPGRLKRWGVKVAFLLVVTVLVLYPRPWMLVRHIDRGLHLSALIEPNAAGVDRLAAEVRRETQGARNGDPQLRAVERVVYRALPYEYDWDNWGVANYFPTAAEAIARGRSDCKGRAVVAASVLAQLGFAPRLVSDLSHVWVWTAQGEAMGPMRTASGRRLIDADASGQRVDLRAIVSEGGVLVDLPVRLGFSINVFPALRTAIIALAVWLIVLRMPPRWWAAIAGAIVIGAGLIVLGRSSPHPEHAHIVGVWAGIALIAAGLLASRVRGGEPNEKARLPDATGPSSS